MSLGLPGFFGRERRRQKRRKPARCHEMLDDIEDVRPPKPDAAEQNPKQSICQSQFRLRVFSLQNAKLLAQGHDFQTEIVSGTERGTQDSEDSWQE